MPEAENRLKKILLAPFVWLLSILFLIEEWLWDWTAALMARLGKSRMVHAVERRIEDLPPRWALFAFLLPTLTIIPAKILGLFAISTGHWLLGSAIFLFAKVTGLALFSRIFNLTRPALMTLPWFARFYAWVMHYRNRIHAYLDNWQAYQRIKRRLHALATAMKTRLSALFRDAA